MSKRQRKQVQELEIQEIPENVEIVPVDELSSEEKGEPIPVDDQGRFKEVRMSMMDIEELGLKNKSQIIRYLISEKYSPSAVSKFLGVRYQHVRNVMVTPLKRVIKEEREKAKAEQEKTVD